MAAPGNAALHRVTALDLLNPFASTTQPSPFVLGSRIELSTTVIGSALTCAVDGVVANGVDAALTSGSIGLGSDDVEARWAWIAAYELQ